jgi:hypothetical protein
VFREHIPAKFETSTKYPEEYRQFGASLCPRWPLDIDSQTVLSSIGHSLQDGQIQDRAKDVRGERRWIDREEELWTCSCNACAVNCAQAGGQWLWRLESKLAHRRLCVGNRIEGFYIQQTLAEYCGLGGWRDDGWSSALFNVCWSCESEREKREESGDLHGEKQYSRPWQRLAMSGTVAMTDGKLGYIFKAHIKLKYGEYDIFTSQNIIMSWIRSACRREAGTFR